MRQDDRPPRTVSLDGDPTGHLGWPYLGAAEFQAKVSRFLATGVGNGERLIFIADDPKVDQWPTELVDSGRLQISSVTEVYGPSGRIDPAVQRATFVGALADALREGYSGIRVAADNTRLCAPDRLDAWLSWEQVADRFIADNPVTGLCAFDRSRLTDETLRAVMAGHETHVSA